MRDKLIELVSAGEIEFLEMQARDDDPQDWDMRTSSEVITDHLIANGVTVQERAEWVHPKEYVVSNGFLCSKCGHEQASYRPINPRPGGGCIADENGNFYYPPKLNYCPDCGAKMMPEPPKEH